VSGAEPPNTAPPRAREQPLAQPYLLRLLDSVEVHLNDVVLQPANEQRAAVRQQEAVHVLGLVHAAEWGEDSGCPPARLREAAGKGVEDLPLPSPRSTPYTAGRGAGAVSPSSGARRTLHKHSQVVKNDEAPS